MGKGFTCSAGDLREECSICGSGRSPREGNGNPLQYSCLGNPMDRGAWQATVHGVAESHTWLINWACVHALECSQGNPLIALFLGGKRMLHPINGTFFWALIIMFTQFRAQIRLCFFSLLLWSESLHSLSWLLVESLCLIIENSQGFLSSVLEYVFYNKLVNYPLLNPSPFGLIHLGLFSLQLSVFFLS